MDAFTGLVAAAVVALAGPPEPEGDAGLRYRPPLEVLWDAPTHFFDLGETSVHILALPRRDEGVLHCSWRRVIRDYSFSGTTGRAHREDRLAGWPTDCIVTHEGHVLVAFVGPTGTVGLERIVFGEPEAVVMAWVGERALPDLGEPPLRGRVVVPVGHADDLEALRWIAREDAAGRYVWGQIDATSDVVRIDVWDGTTTVAAAAADHPCLRPRWTNAMVEPRTDGKRRLLLTSSLIHYDYVGLLDADGDGTFDSVAALDVETWHTWETEGTHGR